ncbi:taste receptor type 2 member 9-like [Bufo gargarizans]|uniref:taste receptor type 2 member 9-like n=1 Tax=Bufo gargarizans TaxID=30331 RepID=UPI001CF547F3|nr:taste receptor type 2 member 9-like [Bufo gargarizans]
MPSVVQNILWIVLLLQTGISVTLNIFIVIVASKSMKSGLKVSPPDVIHLLMGLMNIILQSCLMVQGFLYIFHLSALFIKEVYLPIIVLILTVIYFNSWLNAWLSSFYCTSIVNFTHQLFLWSKKIISTSLWLLLLLSALWSCIISVSSIWAFNVETESNSFNNCTGGSSFIKGTFYFSHFYVQIATFLGSFLPFLLTFLSILLTFSSLIKHVRKMKQNYKGFTQQTHINAIRKMCLLFILTIIFYIAQSMFFSSKPSSSPDALVIISYSVILNFPTANAFIIIQASSKIQKLFKRTLCLRKYGN